MLIFLRRNLAWMLLALALSMSLWTVVTTQQNPDVVDVFQAIPVELRNVPQNLTVRNEVQPVRLVVAASRDVWQDLRPAKFQASVDLSRVGPGLQEIPIEVQSIDPRVQIEDVTPSKAVIHLEPIRRREVPARVRVSGDPPAGYTAGSPRLTPELIAVTGPQSLVEQVVAVTADVSLAGVTTSINGVYRVVPQNANGETVERISVVPENVLVEVPIEQVRAFKTVPVTPQITGAPAPGYQLVGVQVDPTAITIAGEPRTIESIDFVQTQPVDLQSATGDVSRNAEMQLPSGVTLARPQQIVVRAFISTVEGSKTIEIAPTVTGISSGLRASVGSPAVRVTISGPMPVLTSLDPRDVKLVVDASGLTVGTHSLQPRIEVPSSVRVQQLDPTSVDLRLVALPTPTPVATATPE